MLETIIPTYRCDCGYIGPFSAEHEDQGIPTRPGCFLRPLPVDGVEVECPACDQDGCSLSDCLAWVNETGKCPECDGPARIRLEARS